MKRFFLIISLILALVFLTICANKGNQPGASNNISGALKINDYYPFKENVKYIYEGIGNEYASYHTTVDFIEGNRIQLRSNNGGTDTVKVLENKDGQLTMICKEVNATTERPDPKHR